MDGSWTREIIHRGGVLAQGPAPWGEASCIDVVEGTTLLLSPVGRLRGPPLEAGRPTSFQVVTPTGLIRVSGVLLGRRGVEINGVVQDALELSFRAADVEKVNRRAHYRVLVSLRGSLAFFTDEDLRASGASHPERGGARDLESLAQALATRRVPCLVQDLSLGGARAATAPLAPDPGGRCLLDLSLGPDDAIENLSGRVVAVRPEGGPASMPAQVHLCFDRLPRPTEARLSRYLAQVQRELLRKGVRG